MSKAIVEVLMQHGDTFSFCLTIASLEHSSRRLLYANRAYVEMTGYSREETIGRNCRFMQGHGTSPETVRRLRTKVTNREACFQDILNYRKDGSPFWNRLLLLPLLASSGNYYIGIQNDVTETVRNLTEEQRDAVSSEFIKHKLMNPLAIILSGYEALDVGGGLPEDSTLSVLQAIQEGLERINAFILAVDHPGAGSAEEDWFEWSGRG